MKNTVLGKNCSIRVAIFLRNVLGKPAYATPPAGRAGAHRCRTGRNLSKRHSVQKKHFLLSISYSAVFAGSFHHSSFSQKLSHPSLRYLGFISTSRSPMLN